MNHHHTQHPTAARWSDMDTDGRANAIRALHGLSPAQMAETLGTSRNAVLGLAHRRKIAITRHVPQRSSAFQVGREVPAEVWAPLGVEKVDPSARASFAPDWTLLATAAPTRKECCWPVGDGEGSSQMFCGGKRSRGSYCATHAKVAYAPRRGDHPYVDMLRDKSVPPEVTIEEAVALVRPVMKRKVGAE